MPNADFVKRTSEQVLRTNIQTKGGKLLR